MSCLNPGPAALCPRAPLTHSSSANRRSPSALPPLCPLSNLENAQIMSHAPSGPSWEPALCQTQLPPEPHFSCPWESWGALGPSTQSGHSSGHWRRRLWSRRLLASSGSPAPRGWVNPPSACLLVDLRLGPFVPWDLALHGCGRGRRSGLLTSVQS